MFFSFIYLHFLSLYLSFLFFICLYFPSPSFLPFFPFLPNPPFFSPPFPFCLFSTFHFPYALFYVPLFSPSPFPLLFPPALFFSLSTSLYFSYFFPIPFFSCPFLHKLFFSLFQHPSPFPNSLYIPIHLFSPSLFSPIFSQPLLPNQPFHSAITLPFFTPLPSQSASSFSPSPSQSPSLCHVP